MKIGIIGAGHIGGTLARRLTALGHDVSIANSRGPETLQTLARETGAKPVTVDEAAHDKEVVIVTIPEGSVTQLPKHLFDGSEDTVVVDTGNYYPQQRDGKIDAIEAGTPESAWVAQQIGHPVVKAFNTMYAQHLMNRGQPAGADRRIAIPVSADDSRAKAVVMHLVDELGFDPVDAGPLAESWRQQPGTPVYGADLDAAGVRRALTDAPKERADAFRAKEVSPRRSR